MKNIEKFRTLAGYTQAELGEKLGLSRVWISNLEKPDYFYINEEYIVKMCELFGCNRVELYGYDNFREKPQDDRQAMYLIKILSNFIEDSEAKEKFKKVLKEYGY